MDVEDRLEDALSDIEEETWQFLLDLIPKVHKSNEVEEHTGMDEAIFAEEAHHRIAKMLGYTCK